MRLWRRIRNLPYTGFLLWPGNDGLRPYDRRRMAKRYEQTAGKPPKRIFAEGGYIPGPHPDDDGIPVLLSPSEARVSREMLTRADYPWDACLDVDPFTGQPDGCAHCGGEGFVYAVTETPTATGTRAAYDAWRCPRCCGHGDACEGICE